MPYFLREKPPVFVETESEKNAGVKRLHNIQCCTKLCKAQILNNNIFLIAHSLFGGFMEQDGWISGSFLLYYFGFFCWLFKVLFSLKNVVVLENYFSSFFFLC